MPKITRKDEMMLRLMWCVAFLVFSQSASAYDFGSGDIKVPEGFEGPVMKAPSEAFSAVGFTRGFSVGIRALGTC